MNQPIIRSVLFGAAVCILWVAAAFAWTDHITLMWVAIGAAAAVLTVRFVLAWRAVSSEMNSYINSLPHGPHAWMIWPAALFAVPVTVGLLTAPHADAAEYTGTTRSVTVVVTRSDELCINAWVPLDGELVTAHSCDPIGMRFDYLGKSGDLVGANPIEVDGVAFACTVWVDQTLQTLQSGFGDINCLGELA